MVVGIDIGGTFTDLVSCENGRLTAVKVPSTPEDFSEGFGRALRQAAGGGEAEDGRATSVEEIVHATTVATNALIQRKGARIGLLTTRGFRDVLDLRRRDRRDPYGMETAFHPLIPRSLRREVTERSGPDETLVPVDRNGLVREAERLWADGAEAILIGFLHAATCPVNEETALETLARKWPDRLVFASHDLADVSTEFERLSTGAASVYVAPLLRRYLDGLDSRLAASDTLRIVTSDAGLVRRAEAAANPVRTALSGPAAGVWGARAVCERVGVDAFVACDMGGTSFDACLVDDGTPALTRDRDLGFGMPLAVEMLDIATIGAGGGSIVTVSPVGTVEVGPEGVGADPGPACYGRQVHRATVADADLVTGRIPSSLRLPVSGRGSGGDSVRTLDADAARKTINERVARPLGVSVEAAAGLILSTVEEKMADQIRQMALRARVDVSDHVLFAYGGAGPLHAAGIARSLGVGRIIVPPHAGLFSAWGGLLTQRRVTRTTMVAFDPMRDTGRLASVVDAHERALALEGAGPVRHAADLGVDARPRPVTIPIAGDDSGEVLADRFAEQAGFRPGRVVVTRISSTLTEPSCRTLESVMPAIDSRDGRAPGSRDVAFGDGPFTACTVLDRSALSVGAEGTGPCVIEEPGATTLVPPAFGWRVGELGLLHLERTR